MSRISDTKLLAYVEIIRPKQWYKNLLLFVAIVFSKNLGNSAFVVRVLLGFALFCALSGSMYVVNDIFDLRKDLIHPGKSKRPLPSGRISVQAAAMYGAALCAIGLLGAAALGLPFFLMSLAYLASALSYTLLLKRLVVIDALNLGAGFVVRAYAGALVINVHVSPWLIICVFLLALVLSFGKRRHELAILGEYASDHREALSGYSIHMTEELMLTCTATLIMAYSMYTFLAANQWMMLTIPLTMFGLFRFVLLSHGTNKGGEIDIIFGDIPSVINIIVWLIICGIILYIVPPSWTLGGG